MSDSETAQKVVDTLAVLIAGMEGEEGSLEAVLSATLTSIMHHVVDLHEELGLPTRVSQGTLDELDALVTERDKWETKQHLTILPGGKGQREDN